MTKYLDLRANIALALLFAFLLNSIGPMPAFAQDFYLPAPGQMVALSPAFSPAVLKGIQLDAKNPFKFHFFVDRGDSSLSQAELKEESSKLIKYFLASLTIPEKDLWVNLSPYEKNRIVPQEFGQTEMGRDLLAEDYMLKQITASLIYPEDKIGREFWAKVYAQAQAKYGTTDIPINTFNKVWIIPDKAVVYENGGTAFVLENHLKVMLEQDYLSMTKHSNVGNGLKPFPTNQLGSQIVRELVIPQLEHEVNYGKNFSQLRQVFYSLILATWYKKKITDSILNKIYSNRNKIGGVNVSAEDKEEIYQRYLKAFKKGVFNFIQEEPDPATNQTVPRKYFSGGVAIARYLDAAMAYEGPQQITVFQRRSLESNQAQIVRVSGDFAMKTSVIRGQAQSIHPKQIIHDQQEQYILRNLARLPASFLLDELGLADPHKIKPAWIKQVKEFSGVKIYRIELPTHFDSVNMPLALKAFYTDYSAFFGGIPTHNFDLFYSQGLLTAIIPVLTGEKDTQGLARVWDLTPYYLTVPQAKQAGSESKWDNFFSWQQVERRLIVSYLMFEKMYERFANIWGAQENSYAVFNVMDDPAEFENSFLAKRGLSDFIYKRKRYIHSRIELTSVIFPTVYLLEGPVAKRADREFVRELIDPKMMHWKKGDETLVVGPGSGIDSYLAWLHTKHRIHVIDLNPFAIASTRAVAQAAGFKVVPAVNDGLTTPDGQPVFGNQKFQKVIWNMPHIDMKGDSYKGDSFAEKHDGDYLGKVLSKFLDQLPMVLDPDHNEVLIWNKVYPSTNSVDDHVLDLIKSRGYQVQRFGLVSGEEEKFALYRLVMPAIMAKTTRRWKVVGVDAAMNVVRPPMVYATSSNASIVEKRLSDAQGSLKASELHSLVLLMAAINYSDKSYLHNTDEVADFLMERLPQVVLKFLVMMDENNSIVDATYATLSQYEKDQYRRSFKLLRKITTNLNQAMNAPKNRAASPIFQKNGGIDLNPAQMSMQVKKEGSDFRFEWDGQIFDTAQITGASFTIESMSPVTNLPEILGLNQPAKEPELLAKA